MKERKGKKKSETNVYENPLFAMKCGVALCLGQCWDMNHTMDECIYFSYFLSMSSIDLPQAP